MPGTIFLLLPLDAWIKSEYHHCNVLTFRLHDRAFVAVTDCSKAYELVAIGEQISKATGFIFEEKSMKGWEHNGQIEQNSDNPEEAWYGHL
jgi:hypothetical protein